MPRCRRTLEERDAYPRVSDETFADTWARGIHATATPGVRRTLEDRDAYPRVVDETFADPAETVREPTGGSTPPGPRARKCWIDI